MQNVYFMEVHAKIIGYVNYIEKMAIKEFISSGGWAFLWDKQNPAFSQRKKQYHRAWMVPGILKKKANVYDLCISHRSYQPRIQRMMLMTKWSTHSWPPWIRTATGGMKMAKMHSMICCVVQRPLLRLARTSSRSIADGCSTSLSLFFSRVMESLFCEGKDYCRNTMHAMNLYGEWIAQGSAKQSANEKIAQEEWPHF